MGIVAPKINLDECFFTPRKGASLDLSDPGLNAAAQVIGASGLTNVHGETGTNSVADNASNNKSAGFEPHYQVINLETPLGGAIYPFLEMTGRAWSLVTSSAADPAHYPNHSTFGMDKPTLRWVNGDQVKDVFVDGMTTQDFLDATGLQIDMSKKGGFVVSKRLSRLIRPYFASAYFPGDAVSITYLDELDANGAKVWDGAGLISREMLRRVLIPEGVSAAKREELLREIERCRRVEFTLMSADGQDKGHAIVADDLPTDFVLPRDTKGEVKLVNGQKFVGINFVHHHEDIAARHPKPDQSGRVLWRRSVSRLA